MIEVKKAKKDGTRAGVRLTFSRRMLLVFICIAVVASVGMLLLLRKIPGGSGGSNPGT